MIYIYYIGAALMLPVYLGLVFVAGRLVANYISEVFRK